MTSKGILLLYCLGTDGYWFSAGYRIRISDA